MARYYAGERDTRFATVRDAEVRSGGFKVSEVVRDTHHVGVIVQLPPGVRPEDVVVSRDASGHYHVRKR